MNLGTHLDCGDRKGEETLEVLILRNTREGNLTISFVSVDPILFDDFVYLSHFESVISHNCP